ncbi:MAG: hypothetical protein V2I33_26290 [Kangiellaceae bacterium]|nr:hypothetical protein [Kangiellaceae bacterium]
MGDLCYHSYNKFNGVDEIAKDQATLGEEADPQSPTTKLGPLQDGQYPPLQLKAAPLETHKAKDLR